MRVRGVVRRELENDFESAGVRRGEQRVQFGQRAEARIDVAIVVLLVRIASMS